MARGGYRPGGGRPKAKSRLPKEYAQLPPDIRIAAYKAGISPLDYMLAIMNDETADAGRRDRMAVSAAPFCHKRAGEVAVKETKAAAAEGAVVQSDDWGDDLRIRTRPN